VPRIETVDAGTVVNGDAYFDRREFAARLTIEDEHYWHLARRELLLQVMESFVPRRDTPVLEIGCGAGTVATYLNEHGYEVDYADVHKEALIMARDKAVGRLSRRASQRRFLQIDVCRQEVPTGYGAILMLDVIEHLPDDVDVLRRVGASLRGAVPGLVVVTVPAFPMLWSPYDVVERHKRRYTARTARAALEASGFEVLRLTYFFTPLFFAAGAVKLVRSGVALVREPSEPRAFTDLVETRAPSALTNAMLRVLRVERRFLTRRDVPFGTSLLCVARRA
jgi:2-polyprenyl-3-methyl-5-hydroxy-6-metoxy-1,4-benzoquinol methylase